MRGYFFINFYGYLDAKINLVLHHHEDNKYVWIDHHHKYILFVLKMY